MLLNEASRELAGRSEWYKATVEIGPTVAAQGEYTIPSDVHSLLRLKVNGVPWAPGSEEDADRVESNIATLRTPNGGGMYFPTFGATNIEKVELYPVPETAGLSILARAVEYPPTLVTGTAAAGQSTTTAFPDEFDRALEHYVAAHALGGEEDNLEGHQFHMTKFDEKALQLKRLRNSRIGRGPRQLKVFGVHAS